MLQLRIASPADLTDEVVGILDADAAVSSLAVIRGASVHPVGDVVFADVAREATNDVLDRLCRIGVQHAGTIHVDPAPTWLSEQGLRAGQRAPGSSADAVVWSEVTQRAYDDSELNWTYLTFMTLATLLASIAIVVDSQVLVIGAMVLGPEFGAVAALGLAVVRRRMRLFRLAARTLVLGFVLAILVVTCLALVARAIGWVHASDIAGRRPGTSFIYSPDKWSFVVAVVAGAAGVLSLTSARVGGLAGVFISVTTVPAAGNVALGLAFLDGSEIRGSGLQLVVNITGMTLAGWATLAVQEAVWSRVSLHRLRSGRALRRGSYPE